MWSGDLMSTWKRDTYPHLPWLHPYSSDALDNDNGGGLAGGVLASGAWIGANASIMYKFHIRHTQQVTALWACIGAANTGNINLGVYSVDFSIIYATGATAAGTTSTRQIIAASPVFSLEPGDYWMAVAASATTVAFIRHSLGVVNMRQSNVVQVTSNIALSSNPTILALASSYVPHAGLIFSPFTS